MPGQDGGVAAFCESIPCFPAENSHTLGPKDQNRVSVPRMATVVTTRFSETFEGWRSRALTDSRESEETLRLPDFIHDFISYCNFSLPNGLLPPWSGAHYAGLPRCACGAVAAPDGLMSDASCLAFMASFALGWEERSILMALSIWLLRLWNLVFDHPCR